MSLAPNENIVNKATEKYVNSIDGSKYQRNKFGKAFQAGALTVCGFFKKNNKRLSNDDMNMNAINYSYTYYPGEEQECLHTIRNAYFEGCRWADRDIQFSVCRHLRNKKNKKESQSSNK